MPPYNLLIVTSGLYIGGAEVVIQNLSRDIDRRLFNVTVCHLKDRGPIGDDMVRAGIDVIGLPKPRRSKTDYFTFLKLFRILRERKIDLVHTHSPHGLTDSALCKVLRPSLRLVHTFHFGNYPHEAKRRMQMERIFGRMADQLVSVGDHQKQTIQDTYNWPASMLTTIWNGVVVSRSNEAFDLRSIVGSAKRLVIGTICTLYDQKGVTYLLDVAARLKGEGAPVAFVVAGEGPRRKELEAKLAGLGLQDTVFLIGWVKDAAARLLPQFDIFYQPSLWEAMSVVILEAMAAGKPIVATRVGENSRVLEHGRDGMLVEPRNVEEMAAVLGQLASNATEREQLGRHARETFNRKFTAERMARQYEELYLRVLGSSRQERTTARANQP